MIVNALSKKKLKIMFVDFSFDYFCGNLCSFKFIYLNIKS